MRQRLLRALARHVKLVSWFAVLGWLAWIAGAITSASNTSSAVSMVASWSSSFDPKCA